MSIKQMLTRNNYVLGLAITAGVAMFFATAAQEAAAQVPDRYMVVLVDASGSMNQPRQANPAETRFDAARDLAKGDINLFSQVPGNLFVAVWTFQNNSHTPRTNGFVTPGEAITAIDNLPAPGGLTPLAMSLCDAVDELVAATPIPSLRILQLNSDGLENNSDGHPCHGLDSASDIAPFTAGSWENKVYNAVQGVVLHVKVFGADINFRSGHTNIYAGEGRGRAVAQPTPRVPILSFFEQLATSTGGSIQSVSDSAPVPVAGDVNGDFCVDNADIDAVFADFGQLVPPANSANDLNKDGVVDEYDYLAVFNAFGSGCTAAR